MAGSGDHSGFIFDNSIENPRSFPTNQIDQLTGASDESSLKADKIKKSATFSFSEKQPDNLAVVLTDDWESDAGALLTSSDGGVNWVRKTGYQLAYRKSHVVGGIRVVVRVVGIIYIAGTAPVSCKVKLNSTYN